MLSMDKYIKIIGQKKALVGKKKKMKTILFMKSATSNLEFLVSAFNHLVMITLKNENYKITKTCDIIKNNRCSDIFVYRIK